MSDDGDAQQLAHEYEAIQQRLRQLDAHLAALEDQQLELRRAVQTIDALAADQSALVPIGAGFHVRATLHGDQPVVVPVGSGYAADQDAATAKGALEAQATQLADVMRRTEAEADQLAAAANEIAAKAQSSS